MIAKRHAISRDPPGAVAVQGRAARAPCASRRNSRPMVRPRWLVSGLHWKPAAAARSAFHGTDPSTAHAGRLMDEEPVMHSRESRELLAASSDTEGRARPTSRGVSGRSTYRTTAEASVVNGEVDRLDLRLARAVSGITRRRSRARPTALPVSASLKFVVREALHARVGGQMERIEHASLCKTCRSRNHGRYPAESRVGAARRRR